MKISASFLSIKDNLEQNINKLINSNIDYLHVDIMDGQFVENKTDDYIDVLTQLNCKTLDIHLMVNDVLKYIKKYENLNPLYITFHSEVNCDIMSLISYLKERNIKVGLSLKPETSINEIEKYLKHIDMVLVMSVEPGKGGQTFKKEVLEKINQLNDLKTKYNFLIQVDGGINDKNITLLKNIDIAVVGSYITNNDYEQQIKKLKEKIYG